MRLFPSPAFTNSFSLQHFPQFFTAASPVLVDGLCIAQLGGKGDGSIFAFDLATGGVKWQWNGDGPAYGSPVLATIDGSKQLIAQTEKNIVGLALADGKLLWQVASPVQGRAQKAVTPIVDGQTVIFTGQGRGTKAGGGIAEAYGRFPFLGQRLGPSLRHDEAGNF
ncbi:MAG TPA: PQQ-binding-like beta-propeller repeat protein, partial [Tepidisphaeraceae bacterium]|nr:PQQ-binding-like beta-propeller repeat protein [Tepidisphaeraceae bacterium]